MVRFKQGKGMKETLKIRHYVVGELYHAGERSVQIMSSRNLAKQFGMARSTVSIALKELIEQGYLIPVRGKGNFTNPRKIMIPLPGRMPPLILLIHSDGRSFYYGKQEWESISTDDPQAVVDALASGKLIVALMSKGHFTSSGHFMVLRGVTSEGKILVADPASKKRSEQEWDISIILDEARKGAAAGGPLWAIY